MSSTPKSINRLAPERRASQDTFSSSPHREATNRLLSSSPSIPPFFARPASRQSNNSGGGSGNNAGDNQGLGGQTPTSSWRSPSTLQNYRSDDVAGDTSSNNYNNNYNRSGLDSSSNSIHGSYAGSNSGYVDSMNAVVDIPADEASKVVKKHLVLNSAPRDSFDSDRNDNGGGPSSSSNGHSSSNNNNNNDGTGSGDVVDYTTAFKLPGGAITRDVYKWQADQENEQNRRGNSSVPSSFFFFFSFSPLLFVSSLFLFEREDVSILCRTFGTTGAIRTTVSTFRPIGTITAIGTGKRY